MLNIKFENINMSFGKTKVLSDINLDIEPGEFVTFVGPSGCGKTTLLRIVAGLLRQTSGNLYFNQKEISSLSPLKRGIAMVFQSYALYPHLNVYNNIALGLKQSKMNKADIKDRVANTAKMLQMENLLKRYPSELSGGQRQRVAIGRAIARQPEVLLLDEPLSNLDADLRFSVRLEIAKLHQQIKSTTIYVTHDQVEAMTLSDKMVLINKGVIEQTGSPLELYLTPKNLFVAGFLGSPKMNFIEAEINQKNKTLVFSNGVKTPWKHPIKNFDGDKVIFGFRAEHALVEKTAKNNNKYLTGKIISIENMGEEMFLVIEPNQITPYYSETNQYITMKVSGFSGFAVGENVQINFEKKGTQGYLFDSTTSEMISCPDFSKKI